jgi:hypothetical protein
VVLDPDLIEAELVRARREGSEELEVGAVRDEAYPEFQRTTVSRRHRPESASLGTPAVRKLGPMVAAMATLAGHEPEMTGLAEMASESIEGWLHEYDGYRGLLVFTNDASGRARVITLWDTHEDEQRARASRGAMRDQLASTIGVTVEEFEVYDVPVCDVVGKDVEGR